jgi:hypothetical protein
MAGEITATQLSSWLKIVYPKKISNNVVAPAIIFNNTSFGDDIAPGQKVIVPTLLAPEQGTTYGTAGSVAQTNAAIALVIEDATINPAQLSIKSVLPADIVNRAKTSQQAFEEATTLRFREQRKTILLRTEWTWLYGGEAMATINGAPSVATDATVVLSGHSPALCSTLVNAQLDCYNGSTKINTNANLNVKKVTMGGSGAVTLVLSGNAADLAALANGYSFYFQGAYGVEATGLMAQVSNTGTLFGLDSTKYPGFKGNTIAVGGALTMAKVSDGVALVKQFLPEDDLTVFVSPRQFARLVQEQQGLQRWLDGGKNAKVGFTGLALSVGNDSAMLVEHPFVKDADVLMVPLPQVIKVGTTTDEPIDATSAGDFIVWDHNTLSYVYTMYLCCVPFIRKPNNACRLTGCTIS